MTEETEVVFETIDLNEVPVVRSLLESADIPFTTRGEDAYDAFRGAFRGTFFARTGRPVVFLVPRARAEEARALLSFSDDD